MSLSCSSRIASVRSKYHASPKHDSSTARDRFALSLSSTNRLSSVSFGLGIFRLHVGHTLTVSSANTRSKSPALFPRYAVQTIPGKIGPPLRAMHKSLAYRRVSAIERVGLRTNQMRTERKGYGVSEVGRIIFLPGYLVD